MASLDDVPTQPLAWSAVERHSKLLVKENSEMLRKHAGEDAVEIRFPMDLIAETEKTGKLDRMIASYTDHVCPARVPIPLKREGTDWFWQNFW